MGLRWKFVTVHRREFSEQKILHGTCGEQKLVRMYSSARMKENRKK